MDRLLPHSLLEQFGKRESTWLNSNFWRIPGGNLPTLRAALIALAWELRHAPDQSVSRLAVQTFFWAAKDLHRAVFQGSSSACQALTFRL